MNLKHKIKLSPSPSFYSNDQVSPFSSRGDVLQRDTRSGSVQADLTDSGWVLRSLKRRGEWGWGGNLKTKPILCAPCQGWEMFKIAAQKICPSSSQEKRSFRFINSRLKRNYLPIDLNHQQKDTRTKSSFFFCPLKFFFLFYNVVVLFFLPTPL